jgi:hypothetical protein
MTKSDRIQTNQDGRSYSESAVSDSLALLGQLIGALCFAPMKEHNKVIKCGASIIRIQVLGLFLDVSKVSTSGFRYFPVESLAISSVDTVIAAW